MKQYLLFVLLFITLALEAQIPAYYAPVDFGLSGTALRDELGDHITSTHTSPTSYSECWDVLKNSDLDPTNSSDVLLMYGYNDGDGDITNDRTRNKNDNGGSVGEWNREHVFPKSLGSPDLGTSGPGSDPHNLRASDVQMNGNRSNKKFADASGNAGPISSYWYPGDEWKGDAARIIMYMYLRYENRCLPSAVAIGSSNAIDGNMVNILLEWNAEDPVSEFEQNRNDEIHDATGNRNPFIDNPYIATRIWGGNPAEDTWGNLGITTENINFSIYPNPASQGIVNISIPNAAAEIIRISDLTGKTILNYTPIYSANVQINVSEIPVGTYLLSVQTAEGIEVKKLIIQ